MESLVIGMNRYDIRLVAIDIDGTLLNNQGELHTQTIEALHLVREQGIRIALATGRITSSTQRVAHQIGGEVDVVSYNGAYVALSGQDQPITRVSMSMKTIRPLIAELEARELYIKMYIDDHLYVQTATEETIQFFQDHQVPYTEVGIGNLSRLERDPMKLVVIDTSPRLEELYPLLPAWETSCTFFHEEGRRRSIEIAPHSVNKSTGVQHLCRQLGISMQQVMAFGNEGNDLEMIRDVGIGVAMGNGIELLKEIADHVTKSNDDHGVAVALRHFILSSI